jgi:ribulose-5-phosphate 4-epimerase/fuculose-1-phosphate aldolase
MHLRPRPSPPPHSGASRARVKALSQYKEGDVTRFEQAQKKLALVEREAATSAEEERLHRKQRLAATFRIFARYSFDQGLAGHVTVRDPEYPDRFWINPLGQHFSQIRVSDLQLVDHQGQILIGDRPINQAGFVIHSAIHAARLDVLAAAHTHSTYGKAWSSLGRLLDPITQDACAFFENHVLFDPFSGVVLAGEEGKRLAETLGSRKAIILQNHGLLTVGPTVEAAAWWFIAMDNAARTQLLAEAVGEPKLIAPDIARLTALQIGTDKGGFFSFQPLWDWIVAAEPDLLE